MGCIGYIWLTNHSLINEDYENDTDLMGIPIEGRSGELLIEVTSLSLPLYTYYIYIIYNMYIIHTCFYT
jgi:hypothetical protein